MSAVDALLSAIFHFVVFVLYFKFRSTALTSKIRYVTRRVNKFLPLGNVGHGF